MSEFRFCTISLEQMDRNWPKFVYALIFTRSKLRLLPDIYAFATELRPLIDVRSSFPLNTFRANGQPNVVYALILTISGDFLQSSSRVMALS